MSKIKCAICNGDAIEDGVVYTLNPVTFRFATMHRDCWLCAYDDLANERASDTVNYSTRQDEYNQRVL